ncbi:isochorismatase family protein [Curtobacterium sp. VKM Ac-2922]|uniref:isochorismatase family protein n=1 Tax=Curtobacterium sp. VKM Ac-2922 TaxID=2929475 RepID=UPI001FB4D532|nr:isochorismatase family protein [Curtobacterium sp. VKM Ac-2922]MCJ1713437.1 isochorismatase family protein [Curtobacterium sp. VKM Ac-2922]
MTRALIVVDVQNDFTEGGALGVTGGDDLARRITAFLARHADEYDLIVGSRDWHHGDDDNGGHFAVGGDPDFVTTWPVHCVGGTPGAEYHPDLDTTPIDVHVMKGQGEPAYSAFEGTTDTGQDLADVLFDRSVHEIAIVGIATDHCVRATAQDGLRAGLDVVVYRDLVVGVDPDRSATALAEIDNAGGHVDQSDMDEGIGRPGGAQL